MYSHITPGVAVSGVTITSVYSTLCRKLKSWAQLQISLWDAKENAGFKFLFSHTNENWLIVNVTCWQEQQSDNFSPSLDYTSVMRDGAWISVLRALIAQIHCLSWTSSTVFCIKVIIHQVSFHAQLMCAHVSGSFEIYNTSVSIHNQCNELIFPERVLLKFVRECCLKKTKRFLIQDCSLKDWII